MVTMSEVFCTECGAKNDGHNQFCIVCGAMLPKVESLPLKESPVHSEAQQVAESDSDSSKAKFKLSKGKGLVVLAVVLSFVLGVALTSQNVFSAVIGDRYTEKRLRNEKVQSYDLGYSSGESAGYPKAYADGETAGIESGYIRGKQFGCNLVFDKAGEDQVIGIRYPYNAFALGRYYWTRFELC